MGDKKGLAPSRGGDRTIALEKLARLLKRGPASIEQAACPDTLVVRDPSGCAHGFATDIVRDAIATGRAVLHGKALLRAGVSERADARATPSGGVPPVHETIVVAVDGEFQRVAFNTSESPLALLFRRRTKDGQTFLTVGEFEAGERLRRDYTRAMMLPRLSANWSAAVSGKNRGRPEATACLTDSALAARERVDRAIGAIGPELSGVLIDVCRFLKGLETVESERQWPVRSAKLMLKTALAALARHYNPQTGSARSRQRHHHWGASDYKPSVP